MPRMKGSLPADPSPHLLPRLLPSLLLATPSVYPFKHPSLVVPRTKPDRTPADSKINYEGRRGATLISRTIVGLRGTRGVATARAATWDIVDMYIAVLAYGAINNDCSRIETNSKKIMYLRNEPIRVANKNCG